MRGARYIANQYQQRHVNEAYQEYKEAERELERTTITRRDLYNKIASYKETRKVQSEILEKLKRQAAEAERNYYYAASSAQIARTNYNEAHNRLNNQEQVFQKAVSQLAAQKVALEENLNTIGELETRKAEHMKAQFSKILGQQSNAANQISILANEIGTLKTAERDAIANENVAASLRGLRDAISANINRQTEMTAEHDRTLQAKKDTLDSLNRSNADRLEENRLLDLEIADANNVHDESISTTNQKKAALVAAYKKRKAAETQVNLASSAYSYAYKEKARASAKKENIEANIHAVQKKEDKADARERVDLKKVLDQEEIAAIRKDLAENPDPTKRTTIRYSENGNISITTEDLTPKLVEPNWSVKNNHKVVRNQPQRGAPVIDTTFVPANVSRNQQADRDEWKSIMNSSGNASLEISSENVEPAATLINPKATSRLGAHMYTAEQDRSPQPPTAPKAPSRSIRNVPIPSNTGVANDPGYTEHPMPTGATLRGYRDRLARLDDPGYTEHPMPTSATLRDYKDRLDRLGIDDVPNMTFALDATKAAYKEFFQGGVSLNKLRAGPANDSDNNAWHGFMRRSQGWKMQNNQMLDSTRVRRSSAQAAIPQSDFYAGIFMRGNN